MIKSIAITAAFVAATSAQAAPIVWELTDGGNGHAYEFITDTDVRFANAVADAATRSYNGVQGHLATITSAEENAFITAMLPDAGAYYFGASDRDQEGIWKWIAGPEAGTVFYDATNGTAYGYNNWRVGIEPNNLNGSENVIELLGHFPGTWNDISEGRYRAGYIIEYSTAGAVEVPLPASGLLLIGGLGAIALRRRKS